LSGTCWYAEKIPELKQVLAAATVTVTQVEKASKGTEAHRAAGKAGRHASFKALNDALQVLTGPLVASRGLRYKKKMWSFRVASTSFLVSLSNNNIMKSFSS
jgi:hypothetical protein